MFAAVKAGVAALAVVPASSDADRSVVGTRSVVEAGAGDDGVTRMRRLDGRNRVLGELRLGKESTVKRAGGRTVTVQTPGEEEIWTLSFVTEVETAEWLQCLDILCNEDSTKLQALISQAKGAAGPATPHFARMASGIDLPSPNSSDPSKLLVKKSVSDAKARSQEEQFKRLFVELEPKKLRQKVAGGLLYDSTVRSICWRRFLGLLGQDMAEWGECTRRLRLDYDQLVGKHMLTEKMVLEQSRMIEKRLSELLLQMTAGSGPESAARPASYRDSLPPPPPPLAAPSEASCQAAAAAAAVTSETKALRESLEKIQHKYAQSKELESLIWKDLDRTKVMAVSIGAQNESTAEAMLRILLVWAKVHPSIGYKQGMSELLATILYVLHHDYCQAKVDEPNAEQSFCQVLTDSAYLEHDAYLLLDRILSCLLSVYEPSSENVSADVRDFVMGGDTLDLRPSALPLRLEHIQHRLLQRADPELAAHLHTLGIEPHMYLIRWLRVLFAREIAAPLVLLVWDAIFALTPNDFKLVNSVCVAILTNGAVRSRLMQAEDVADALQSIRELPGFSDQDIFELVVQACRVHFEYEKSIQLIHAQLEKQAIEAAAAELEKASTVGSGIARQLSTSSSKGSGADSEWLKIDAHGSDLYVDGEGFAASSSTLGGADSKENRTPVLDDLKMFAGRIKYSYKSLLRKAKLNR